VRPSEFLTPSAKRLLQHYRENSGSNFLAASISESDPNRKLRGNLTAKDAKAVTIFIGVCASRQPTA
jgi:hypothetical protein